MTSAMFGHWRNIAFAITLSAILLFTTIPTVASKGNGNSNGNGNGNGNPQPGYPHDTVMIHIQKITGNPNNCNGGRSLHIGAYMDQGNVISIPPTNLTITMQDWVQVDNDNDGSFDEDPVDGIDNDLDGLVDEDPKEPGAETKAIDCDSRDGDGKV